MKDKTGDLTSIRSKIISLLKDEKFTKHNELVRALIMIKSNPDNGYMMKAIKCRSDFKTLSLDSDFQYHYRAAKKSIQRSNRESN